MNRRELVETIATRNPTMTKKNIDRVISDMVEIIPKTVKKGEDVTIRRLGTWTKVVRAARKGVNPSTMEAIKIPKKVVPKFRTALSFKKIVNPKHFGKVQ